MSVQSTYLLRFFPHLQLTSLSSCLVQDSESALSATDRITSLDDIARPAVATAVLDTAYYGGGASCDSRDSCGWGGTSWGVHCLNIDLTVANAELGRDLFLKKTQCGKEKEHVVKTVDGGCFAFISSSVGREGSGGDSSWSTVMGAVRCFCAHRRRSLIAYFSHEAGSPSVAHFVFGFGATNKKHGGNQRNMRLGDDSSFL